RCFQHPPQVPVPQQPWPQVSEPEPGSAQERLQQRLYRKTRCQNRTATNGLRMQQSRTEGFEHSR
ncbi:hypothetical protein OX90_10315, partial [Pseudomonas coronafaciens pv. porri]